MHDFLSAKPMSLVLLFLEYDWLVAARFCRYKFDVLFIPFDLSVVLIFTYAEDAAVRYQKIYQKEQKRI